MLIIINHLILLYYIQFVAVGTKSYNDSFTETKNFTAPEDARMIVLTELTPGTTYNITALAVNGAGLGETETTSEDTLNGTKKLIHIISISLTSCQFYEPFRPISTVIRIIQNVNEARLTLNFMMISALQLPQCVPL